ncbi:MAG: hypothetical protein ACPGED_00725 [Flavobacteriales bacterium]
MEEEKVIQNDEAALNYISHLITDQGRSKEEVIATLVKNGKTETEASVLVEAVTGFDDEARSKAQRNILFGGLWCVGGTVATFMDIGFIFWGAILFGAIQCIMGIVALASTD